jgi:hypothetical protein
VPAEKPRAITALFSRRGPWGAGENGAIHNTRDRRRSLWHWHRGADVACAWAQSHRIVGKLLTVSLSNRLRGGRSLPKPLVGGFRSETATWTYNWLKRPLEILASSRLLKGGRRAWS